MVALEEEEALSSYELLEEAVLYTSPASSSLLPIATPLLEKALEGDMRVVHTLFRLNRCLTNVVQVMPLPQRFAAVDCNNSRQLPGGEAWAVFVFLLGVFQLLQPPPPLHTHT